jgi:hypothetical protein
MREADEEADGEAMHGDAETSALATMSLTSQPSQTHRNLANASTAAQIAASSNLQNGKSKD